MLSVSSLSIGAHPYGLLAGEKCLLVEFAKCANNCCHKCAASKSTLTINAYDLLKSANTVDTVSLIGGDLAKQDQGSLNELRTVSHARGIRLVLSSYGESPLELMPNEHLMLIGPSKGMPCDKAVLAASEIVWRVKGYDDLNKLDPILSLGRRHLTLCLDNNASVGDLANYAASLRFSETYEEALAKAIILESNSR